MKRVLLLLTLSLFISCKKKTEEVKTEVKENPEFSALHDGDIIFQTSLSSQSQAIQMATKSVYSHCGVIYKEADKYYVFEAIQPVTKTPLEKWIARGKDSHYVVKRLNAAKNGLKDWQIREMKEAGKEMAGKDYDLYFGWGDDKIYCSELVWKLYHKAGADLCPTQQLKDFDLTNNAVKQKLHERYGSNIPMEEKVVSPAALFNSSLLYTVTSK
ncbi:YiiX family permuted papain-like enzyme [Flavobacterium alkalisoli]|uniref:YiiX family permuted papain-like enzyme n=1 Tax=Flavobacterium alkalisoli TaxID=2602769 RepID=UPI003A955771